MWRLQTKTTIKTVDNQATRVNRVAWQPGQGGQLALATNNGGKLVKTGLVKKEIVDLGAGRMHELAWSPAGDLLATEQGRRWFSWNSNGTLKQELHMPPMPHEHFGFHAPKFSNDGTFIIVSYKMSGLMQFHKLDTSTGDLQQSFWIPSPSVLTLLPLEWKNELEVFWQGLNKTINLWRIGQREPLQTITIPENCYSVEEMAFNPKTNILAFFPNSATTTVSLWETDTRDMAVSLLTGHDDHVVRIVWQSDHSDILAVLDLLGGIRIWETTTHTPLHHYNAHYNEYEYNLRASFSPDGRFIAVAGQGEVKIVEFDTGDTVAVGEVSRYTEDLGWSPRGDKLAVVPLEVGTADLNVFNVDKINFGINLKGLSLMRVASLLEGNLVNGKDEAREFLENEENKIPKTHGRCIVVFHLITKK